MPLKTLFLNPPSFENFDGGASSRWPATREIESYWYPVWLAYPAGMLEGSKLLDAPPHHVSADETIEIAKSFDFLVLFTSTVGWSGDHGLARAIKNANPSIKIAFVGPPVTTDPDRALNECEVIDFVCRREFDFSVVEYANGKPLNEILVRDRLMEGDKLDAAGVRQPAIGRHQFCAIFGHWFATKSDGLHCGRVGFARAWGAVKNQIGRLSHVLFRIILRFTLFH